MILWPQYRPQICVQYFCLNVHAPSLTYIDHRELRRPFEFFTRTGGQQASQFRAFFRIGLACVYDAPLTVLRLMRAQVLNNGSTVRNCVGGLVATPKDAASHGRTSG